MNKELFRKMAAAGLALLLLIALAPDMGLATDLPNYYTITYHSNRPGDQSPDYDYVRMGNLYVTKANEYFSYANHTFIGWNTEANGSGTLYGVGSVITVGSHLSLYATWMPLSQSPKPTPTPQPTSQPTPQPTPQPTTVTITYKSNYAGGQDDVVDNPVKGSSYTIRCNPFTRPGYTFTGWNTKPDGTGNAIKEGELRTANGNNTLYAQWTQNASETVTITYKANYAGGPEDVIDIVSKGISYKLRSNPFVRENYTFAGWNTQANGSGTTYNPGQTLTANGNHTLYAKWKAVVINNIPIPISDMPTGVDGRILPADKAGDSSDWIEIARNGSYSLIVRKFSVNNVYFGTSTAYVTSNARKACNDFFNATNPAISKQYEILPADANLRNYTVMSNAYTKMGTSCADPASLYDGFSKPTGVRAIAGDDVCFCLSFCESANFFAYAKFMRGKAGDTPYTYVSIQPVPALAVSNFRKVHQSNQNIWLRNPGDCPDIVACITYPGSVHWGTVFQDKITSYGLVHPAVWVEAAIFN